MLILFQLQTLQRIYELLGLNGEDMKRESLQLWDGGHLLERVLLHALEPPRFNELRRAKETIQNVTKFFR